MSRALRAVVAVAFVASVIAVASSSACEDYGEVSGSNEQDAGPAMGDRGGKCFPDGQCKTGLVCIDNAICVMPGTGADGAPLPEASVDAAGDGSGDANTSNDGDTCVLTIPPEDNGVSCGTVKCTFGQICCSSGANIGKCVQVAECDPNHLIRCDSDADCTTNESCCVKGTPKVSAACPSITILSSSCVAEGLCGPQGTKTCLPGFPVCGAGNCRAVRAYFDDETLMRVLGLCL